MGANDKAKLIAHRMHERDDLTIHALDQDTRPRAGRNLTALAREYPATADRLLLFSLHRCVNDVSAASEENYLDE